MMMTVKPPDRTDETAMAIGQALRALLRAGRGMQTAMAHGLNLGDTDLAAMDEIVSSEQPLGPVELGNRLGIRSASATVLVDRLEHAGHLRRERHSTDRRRLVLHASESAQHQVRVMLWPMLGRMAELTASLDEEQAAAVLRFLHDATEVIQDFSDDLNRGRTDR